MQNQLLLLQDVEALGRSGDLVSVKPGYARNFLIPKKKAVVADKHTLKLRARLVEERAKQAAIDKKDAEVLAAKYESLSFDIQVKVDSDGKMYGSVAATDIVKLCSDQGLEFEKKQIALAHPIKNLGEHKVDIKLKEGVIAKINLVVNPDRVITKPAPEPQAEQVAEEVEESQE